MFDPQLLEEDAMPGVEMFWSLAFGLMVLLIALGVAAWWWWPR